MHFKTYWLHSWLPLKVHPKGIAANFNVKRMLSENNALLLQSLLTSLHSSHTAHCPRKRGYLLSCPTPGSSRAPSQVPHPRHPHPSGPVMRLQAPQNTGDARTPATPWPRLRPQPLWNAWQSITNTFQMLIQQPRKEPEVPLFYLLFPHQHGIRQKVGPKEKCCHMIL